MGLVHSGTSATSLTGDGTVARVEVLSTVLMPLSPTAVVEDTANRTTVYLGKGPRVTWHTHTYGRSHTSICPLFDKEDGPGIAPNHTRSQYETLSRIRRRRKYNGSQRSAS